MKCLCKLLLIAAISLLWACESGPCPSGAEMEGAPPPEGTEFKCRKEVDGRKVRHGPFAQWHDPQTKKAEGAYVDGKRHGTFNKWNEQGQLVSSEIFAGGQKHGISKSFRGDGTPTRERTYAQDVLHGPSKTWDSDGNLAEEGTYTDGKKHGTWTVWVSHEPKELKQVMEFAQGQITGEIRLVDGTGADMDPSELAGAGATGPVGIEWGGKVVYEGNLVLGLREGEWTSRFKGGEKAAVFNYRSGVRDGAFEIYDQAATLLRKGTYSGGKLAAQEQFDANPVVKFSEELFEIPEADGVLRWGPIAGRDRVFVVTESGVVHSIMPKSRGRDWRWKSPSPAIEAPEVVYADSAYVLRVLCKDGKVRLVDVKKGELRKESALPTTPTPPEKPRIDTFRVLDGTKLGAVSRGFDELWWLHDAGAKISAHIPWKIPGSSYTSSGVALGTDTGKLIVLDAKTGEVAFEHDVGMPIVHVLVAYKHLVVFVKSPEGYRYQLWEEPQPDGLVSSSEPVSDPPLVQIHEKKTSGTFVLGDSYFTTDSDDKPVKGSPLKLKGPVVAVMNRALFAGGEEPEMVAPSWYSIIKERHVEAVEWRHPWPESMRCKEPRRLRLGGEPFQWYFGCEGERLVWWLHASQVKEPKPDEVWRHRSRPTVQLEEVEGILVGATYEALWGVDLETGLGLWSRFPDGKTTFQVQGATVIGAAAGNIFAVNLVTGKELWEDRFYGTPLHSMVTPTRALRMYANQSDGVAIDALDTRLGVRRWSAKDLDKCSGGEAWSVVGQTLMVCSGKSVVGLSLDDGSYSFERPLESGPTFTENAVLDVHENRVLAIGEDGELLWKSEKIPMEQVERRMSVDASAQVLQVTGANYTDDGEHVEEEKQFYLNMKTGKRVPQEAYKEPMNPRVQLYGKDYTFSWMNEWVALSWGGRDQYTQGVVAYDYRFDKRFMDRRPDLAKALGVTLSAE